MGVVGDRLWGTPFRGDFLPGKNPATRTMRVLAVSGYGRADDIRKAREAGFDDHLTKPMDPQELLKWLGSPGA